MGLFDFLKKNDVKTQPSDSMNKLTKEGELPWGWVAHNKAFTEKIQDEFSHFLNMWLESRNKSPIEQFSALKSFVLYLEDAERLCKSKGECFEWWFYNILVSTDYIFKRKQELNALTIKIKKS